MIDLVMSDLKRYQENIDEEFKAWYNLPTTRAKLVDVQTSVPRLAKGWSRFISNVENNGPKSYCKRAVAVPFLDDINSQLQDRLQDRNRIDIFAFLPSIMSCNIYKIDEATEFLFHGYKSEVVMKKKWLKKRWFNLRNNKSYQKKQITDTTQTPVDGKNAYIVESPPDSFVDVLKVANID